jgi:putative FmdB family regulatory protein
MPFYEYECSSCKFYTEVLQKVSDAPLRKCPSCGKNALIKLVSAPVFRLKGGGWYETDFKSDKEGKRNLHMDKEPAANEPNIEGKGKDEKAADAKPAPAAAETKKAADAKPAAGAERSRKTVAVTRKPAAKPKAKSKPRRGRSGRR